jgi:NitT/TauT family transport system substrate-binding protein
MKPPIRVARTLWAGLFPLYIMEALNLMLDVFEIVDVEEYDETLLLLENGEIDANFNSLADALLLIGKGIDLKLVMASDLTIGVDGVVSHPSITQVQQLAGKRIGLSLNTYPHVLIQQILEQYGLKEEDVELVNVRGEQVPQWLQKGEIDAGHTWGIHLQEALDQGGRLLFTSAEYPGLLVDSLFVRADVLRDHRDEWLAFVKAHDAALAYWQANPQAGMDILSQGTGYQAGEIEKMLEGVEFITHESGPPLFDQKGASPPNLYASGRLFMDFYLEKGVLRRPLRLEEIIQPIGF